MISERKKAGLVALTYFIVDKSCFSVIVCRLLGDKQYYIFVWYLFFTVIIFIIPAAG